MYLEHTGTQFVQKGFWGLALNTVYDTVDTGNVHLGEHSDWSKYLRQNIPKING